MRIGYAGLPGTVHTAAWLAHLGSLGSTQLIEVARLAEADLQALDVLVVDAPGADVPALTLDQLCCPTVLVGHYGTAVGETLHLKLGTWFGCKCLHEDAIVWNADHPVFAGLAGDVVPSAAPANFLSERGRQLFDCPDLLPTLRVVDTADEPGQVTTGMGFLDSPECELIAGGINDKTVDHFAIGRQGRFLQWGFAGAPSDWTPAGRTLFAACLEHIRRFADDPVRELRTTTPRAILQFSLASPVWRGEGMPREIQELMQQAFLQRTFVGEPPRQVLESIDAALDWFTAHRGFLRNDGQGWYVDQQAQSYGISIDDPAFLETVLKAKDAELWLRYTGKKLDVSSAAWLDEHRTHLYFTDWGGYRWVSTLEPPNPQPPTDLPRVPEPVAMVAAARYDGITRAVFSLTLPDGFHAYGVGAEDGLPLALVDLDGVEVVEDLELFPAAAEQVSGIVQGRFAVRGPDSELRVGLRVQLCDELTCLAPQTLDLTCPILEGTP